jgi:hypothetical protein
MRKISARSRGLLVIVALATITAMCTVSTARAASSPAGAGGMSTAASHGPSSFTVSAAPSGQCTFVNVSTCQSTDPTVALNVYYSGDTSDCTFTDDVSWGDGDTSQNLVVIDPPDGWQVLAQHTYATSGVYSITETGQATNGCTVTPFTVTFTLLAAPSASCPAVSNPIWNGYVVCGNGFSSISALWTVPAAHGGGNKKAAFWVGLGGLGNGTTLAQDGTESNVVNGKAVYTAWWEFVPSPAVFLSRHKYPLHAGDVMAASVTVTNSDHFNYKLTDYGPDGTHYKWSWTFELTDSGGTHASAEVIVEDTSKGPLTNFGTVTFSQVTVDDNVMAAYGAHEFTAPGGKVSVSNIGDTAEFTVTFKHS